MTDEATTGRATASQAMTSGAVTNGAMTSGAMTSGAGSGLGRPAAPATHGKTAPPHEKGQDPRRWKALGVLALVQFMLVLDITVVNVALPSIKTDLEFSQAGLAWVVDGYVLTAGGLLLLGGRLGDLLGRRRMFFAGILLFTLASVTAGAAQAPGMLVASRFVQGAGEALAAPAAFGLIALLFLDKQERIKALGIFGGVAGLGGTFGPIISGLLLELSWRWIFFVNVPVAAFALFAVARLVDESRAERASGGNRPDIAGAVLITAGLTGVVYGLIEAATHSWGSFRVLGPIIAGVLLLASFVAVESRASDPLVPLRFFHNRTRVTANGLTLIFASVFFTMFFVLTLYWAQVEGWSALKIGMAYLPFGIGIGAGIGMATGLIGRIGTKPVITLGLALIAVGVALLSRISVDGSYLTEPLPALLCAAVGSGFCFAGFGNASVHEVSEDDASLASGVQNSAQQIGGAIGLAVLATLALRHAEHLMSGGTDPAAAATSGYALALRIGAVVLAIGAFLAGLFLEKIKTDPEVAAFVP
ncbi:MAG: putative transrane efflux protein [Frankiales bacterium]|nr:putative transrane efflux protein [Frankiales bacterium]